MRHTVEGVSLRDGARRREADTPLMDDAVRRPAPFPIDADADSDAEAVQDALQHRWMTEEADLEEEDAEPDLGVDASQPGVSTPAAMYLREISRVPLLNAADEVSLAQAIEHGKEALGKLSQPNLAPEERSKLRATIEKGDAARRRLTESNLRLVVSVAKRYVGRGVPLLDLIQEGNIGLTRAVERLTLR